MMRGIIAGIPFRTGGFVIPVVNTTSSNIETIVNLPAKSRILCGSCNIENESELISNGSIVKESTGYHVLKNVKELKITRSTGITKPLTILNGREILYCDMQDSKVYLPKGARINGIVATSTGEITITSSDNYLIEY